ncbi:hypothetical protein HOY80DRAFT_282317 [Tuber brumale]|nr:hypothetical protein HOY80DRAFT_282317 [Tuber brumale]
MSANAPNAIVPRDSDLTPAARLQAVTTYLDQAIKNNTEIIDTLQTRLARVHSHFEASPPQTHLQTGRINVIVSDLGTVSQTVIRLMGGGTKKEEKRMEQKEKEKEKEKEGEGGKEEGRGRGKWEWEGKGKERREKAKEANKEKAKVNITTTTTTLTGALIPAPPVANRPSPEHPITAANPPVRHPHPTSPKSPKPRTPPTRAPRGTLSSPYIINSSPSPFVPGDTATRIHEPTKADHTTVEVKKEPEDENQNVITISTTATQNETRIPSLPTPNHKSPGHPAIATNSTPLPVTLEKATTTDVVTKSPGERTAHEVLQVPRRQSMHTTQSAQKRGTPIAGQSSYQTSAKATTKARSPILEPTTGARTTKKAIEGVSSQPSDKVEPKPQVEMDMEVDVEMDKEPENQNQNTTTTTTSKSTKPRRAKAPGKVPRSPQRRSTRITESVQKRGTPIPGQSSYQTPAKATTEARSPILKPKAGGRITKKKATRGVSSQFADKVEPKPQVEMDEEIDEEPENQNQNTANTATTATGKSTKPRRAKTPGKVPRSPQRRSTRIMESMRKAAQDKLATPMPSSPILKPKARAGVSKRGGRGRGAARRRGN